jgi:putative tricarboxylic transport membrane protein
MAVKRKIWIEGLILIGISIVSLIESLRLIYSEDPQTMYDALGPGYYLLLMSVGMMVTSIAYLIAHLLKLPKSVETEQVSKEMKFRFWGSFGGLILYLILIPFLGYLVPTFIFLVLEFWVNGIKSWLLNIALSSIVGVVYWYVFVIRCSMVFPRGTLF